MCQKVIDRYQYEQELFPYQYNGQDMLKSFVSWKPFILEYWLNTYKAHKMCEKAIDAYPLSSKQVSTDFDNAGPYQFITWRERYK